jgi:enoyl-CoA hydratase/carnithine racemase
MTEHGVRQESADGVVRVTLDRPERGNALDAATVERLLEAVRKAEAEGARLLILDGAGRSFCTGFDLGGLDEASDGDLLWRFVRIELLLQRIYHAPFATLALAKGNVFGAGADLFCACQHRITAPDARLLFPGVRFGLLLGTRRLAARVGPDTARALLSRRVPIDAETARRVGLSDRTEPPEAWADAVEEIRSAAFALESGVTARINAVTRTDTRALDMADLVASACQPGLGDRIRAYVRSLRKA